MTALLVPLLVCAAAGWALYRRVDVFSALIEGARDGLGVVFGMLPSLVALLSAVYMLRASGALEALAGLLQPLLRLFGIPSELVPLMLLRPLSGSGALAVGTELISSYGPGSLIGHAAAIMLGSTETTFYVVAVYFGASGAKKVRRAIPAALLADLTGFIMSALTARLFF